MLSNVFSFFKRIIFSNDSDVESKKNCENKDMSERNENIDDLLHRFKNVATITLKNNEGKDGFENVCSTSDILSDYIEKNILDVNDSVRIWELIYQAENNLLKNNKAKDYKNKINFSFRGLKKNLSVNKTKESEGEISVAKNDINTEKKSDKAASDNVTAVFNKLEKISDRICDVKNECSKEFRLSANKLNEFKNESSENKRIIAGGIKSINNGINKLNDSRPVNLLKKDDFLFELDSKFKEFNSLKEVAEELESLPASNRHIKAELSIINDKLDNLPASSSSKKQPVKVPEDVQAVDDLAKYMRDGVDLFENMSRLYVSRISDIENLDKIEKQKAIAIEDAKKNGLTQGALSEKCSIAKEIANKFPSQFDAIKSVFDEVIEEKHECGSIIDVTNDNKNDLMPYFSTQLELMKYEVVSPAILIDGDIIIKADIKTFSSIPVESIIESSPETVTKED